MIRYLIILGVYDVYEEKYDFFLYQTIYTSRLHKYVLVHILAIYAFRFRLCMKMASLNSVCNEQFINKYGSDSK